PAMATTSRIDGVRLVGRVIADRPEWGSGLSGTIRLGCTNHATQSSLPPRSGVMADREGLLDGGGDLQAWYTSRPADEECHTVWTSCRPRLKMLKTSRSIGAVRDGGSGAAGNEVRAAGTGPDRLPGTGEGPPDLVLTSGSFGHVDMAWE